MPTNAPHDSFDPPVVIRLYETYHTFLPIHAQFPKLHRYTIGEAVNHRILAAIECVFEANAMPRPLREVPLLKALAAAECASLLLRCCVEVHILEMTPFLQLTANLREIRKMLHGWIAYVRSGPNTPHTTPSRSPS
ncbi:MAG: four helix bundle protein [Candidatus Uhrbacteria bacterium]